MQTKTTISVGGQTVKVRSDKTWAVVSFRSHPVPFAPEDPTDDRVLIPFAHQVMATDSPQAARAAVRRARVHAGPGVRVVAVQVATGALLGTK